jgi:acyl carrier protein phosphodiesterase
LSCLWEGAFVHYRINLGCLNYLAHAYLSFGSADVLVGNMISDFVKGKAWEAYSPGIQKGIKLHRKIDDFTDTHPVFKAARQYLAPAVGRYSGAFLDITYDHFLSTDPERFTPTSLEAFSQDVYRTVRKEKAALPPAFLKTFRYMAEYDWLTNYSRREGLSRSLEGMVRRAKYLPDEAPVYTLVERHYDALEESYHAFFPELESYVRKQILLQE